MKSKKIIFSALMLLTMAVSACNGTTNPSTSGQSQSSSSGSEDSSAASEHNWATAWSFDSDYHWHACADCNEVNDKAAHDWDEGTVTVQPSAYKPGEKQFKCKTCQLRLPAVELLLIVVQPVGLPSEPSKSS